MHELPGTEYHRVRPLFQAMDHHLGVSAILEGTLPAKIYTDHPLHPQVALTWTQHRFYAVGSEDNDHLNEALIRFFTETAWPQAREAGEKGFVLYYQPDHWEPKLDATKAQRQFYRFKELRYDWRTLLPEGFVLQFVDRALLDRKHLKNLDALTEEVRSWFGSVQDFLEVYFGVCLLHGDEIVGWCLSEYNGADRCEVGILTIEPYRQRGLATVMASALIEHALSRAISYIGWHCYANNVASGATARKVGFEKVRDYPVYVARFDRIQNVSLRKATAGDAPVITHFLRSMVNEMALLGGHPVSQDEATWENVERVTRAQIDEQDHHYLLAETIEPGPRAVGVAEAGVVDLHPVFEPRRVLHIHALYVGDSHRRRGIGQELLEAILDWGRSRGCAEAELNTLVVNPARSLYEKLGFRAFEIEMRRQL
jgi:RimJ/RimL family protein N-acetyltransferase